MSDARNMSLTIAFARSVGTGMEPMDFFLKMDFEKLWKLRLHFSWEPGLLGEYMRHKAHADLRGIIQVLRSKRNIV